MVMHSGDVLVAYTDGLIEGRRPGTEDDFFGEEGLRRTLDASASGQRSAREICSALAEAAMAHAGDVREDDVTVVVARRV